MKRFNFIVCTVGIVFLLMVSCNKKDEIKPSPIPSSDLIRIIKLKQSEYKPYILANYSEALDSISAYRYNNYGKPVGKGGYSPYWDLADDWLLIDWKWGGFPYCDNAVQLTQEPWENLQRQFQTWPKETPYITNPIAYHYYVPASKLAQCRNKSYEDIIGYINMPFYPEVFDPDVDIARLDSIWTILQADLSTVIEKGELDQITQEDMTCE